MTIRDPELGYIDTGMWVPKKHVSVDGVKRALMITCTTGRNKEEETRYLYSETETHVRVPRAFWKTSDFPCRFVDLRPRSYPRVPIESKILLDHLPDASGKLRPTGKDIQRRATAALEAAHGGVLQLRCGGGKTVIMLNLIAKLGMPAIIIFDNTNLLNQWAEEIGKFLVVPGGIGRIQADVFDWDKSIVLATYQTLANRADDFPEEARKRFGVAVWDEGHHLDSEYFSRSADMFYGKRYVLTATPEREDGLHVVHEAHCGQVLFMDLLQELVPQIVFLQTGLTPDEQDPFTKGQIYDATGEVHFGKYAAFSGEWVPKRRIIQNMLKYLYNEEHRKILVLGRSVDALINHYAAWIGRSEAVSSLSYPTPLELGITINPVELPMDQVRAYEQKLEEEAAKPGSVESKVKEMMEKSLERHRAFKKVEKAHTKVRKEFIKQLIDGQTDAALLTYEVMPDIIAVKKARMVFAILKYGKEGYDDPSLDTVVLLEPISSEPMLQQIIGRPLRHKVGKQEPLMLVFEDKFEAIQGMCQKMRRLLDNWPTERGGPYHCKLRGPIKE